MTDWTVERALDERPSEERRLRLLRLLDNRTHAEVVELYPRTWPHRNAVVRDRERLAGGAR